MISGPVISAKDALPLLGSAVLLDARAGSGARAAFVEAHAEGAIYVDLEAELSSVDDPRVGGRHPLPELDSWLERIGAWGIDRGTPVLIYDEMNSGMAAARAWWMLDAIGHEALAVIDGGWAALREAGARVECGDAAPRRGSGKLYSTPVLNWPTVDAGFVDRVRTDAGWRVIDARAPERYAGLSEPIDPLAGHIPGARNLHWQTQVDATGRFLDQAQLRAGYAAVLDDVPPERVVCYCGSGVTACHLLLAMSACGLRGARLYVGSWSEWCRTREGAS